ncbi:hypothetical protein PT285_10680 [Lactobacillus sp. ESL0791]|uniref:helix-turn-helix domain-containing protein n=1 Tax=Lactobacillus sp. ESL0791 TaxID=2983234 RepID=UPI0023F82803|nr:Rgg/GadR/MutR family transcriptional regulator [Lactobacillus sp. ESL0791]MDF7639866.1 hypothetical protein [Lactobacillus sp. ESL0791]
MTLGQLLKKYRTNQKKTQKDWCQDVISPSFYGKVEKDRNKIAVQDLLKLLSKNNISAPEFFSDLTAPQIRQNTPENELNNLISETYYYKSAPELRELRQTIAQSKLANKEEPLAFIDGYLALITGKAENFPEDEQKLLKEKIFNISDFTSDNLGVYSSFMMFYSVDSNLLLVRKIITRYQNTKDINIKITILSLIFNLLVLCIMYERYDETQFFIEFADGITTSPESFFYKNGLLLFENMIYYHADHQEKYLSTCQIAINNFTLLGMPSYADKMRNFFNGYLESLRS